MNKDRALGSDGYTTAFFQKDCQAVTNKHMRVLIGFLCELNMKKIFVYLINKNGN